MRCMSDIEVVAVNWMILLPFEDCGRPQDQFRAGL
jgi:hypothetical protein